MTFMAVRGCDVEPAPQRAGAQHLSL